MSVPILKIGDSNVPAIGLGLMSIIGAYAGFSHGSDDERLTFLDYAYAQGCTFWDSADIYGDADDLLGKWFKRTGKRGDIFLATKFGIVGHPERFINGDPTYVKESAEKTLRRLGIETIDLYYLHRADKTVPIELVKWEGKVKYLGLSEISAETLRRAHAVHPISVVQVEYSPLTLDIEHEDIGLLKACRELGVKIVAYAPLGRGLLTGQIRSNDDIADNDWRKTVPRYGKDNFPNILRPADGLKAIGETHNAASGQISLAWILAQGQDIIVIPGTSKIKYLDENIGAASVKLTQDELDGLRGLAEKVGASHQGSRYDPAFAETLFVNTSPL